MSETTPVCGDRVQPGKAAYTDRTGEVHGGEVYVCALPLGHDGRHACDVASSLVDGLCWHHEWTGGFGR